MPFYFKPLREGFLVNFIRRKLKKFKNDIKFGIKTGLCWQRGHFYVDGATTGLPWCLSCGHMQGKPWNYYLTKFYE